MNTPKKVLTAIAHECGCMISDIEATLEAINDSAGLARRPIPRVTIAEARLDAIRAWLGTPEACSVVDQARVFVAQMRAP